MKASIGGALAVLAGACLAVRAEAQSVVVGPRANSMAVVPGAQVTVPIVADLTSSGGRSLGSITARLSWRPGVLALEGVGAGALGPPTVNADSTAGTLRFALANPGGATGQPVLLNATFAAIGAPGANDTLRLTLQELTNAGTFADLLPIGQAMNASVCVSTGLFGDLTSDGAVNSADALVILTNAVGLPIAPRTTANGDADGDGQVSTRDALVVLSYAVGLPVGGFRVARLNPGACALRTAASVQLAPRTVAVTSGDRVPLTAVVRDSAGATIQGTGLLWTSADTTVVKTDAAGNVVAVNPGMTLVYANVAPGIKDSVTVSVSATRRVWYVDQVLAARNGGVELGSASYPFGTIRQALVRAAANDSVMIAPATYGEGLRITAPLTLVGDSTAAGATTIRNSMGPGVVADTVASGLVRLERLHIDDAQGGVIVRGAGTAVVELKGVTVARSRGVGISVRRVERLLLDGVTVRGAVHQGIEVDSVPKVRSHAVLVDVVSEQMGVPRAMRVAWADSVVVDSLFVLTAGVRLDSVVAASFNGFTSRDTRGPAIEVHVRTAFTLDRGDVGGAVEVDTTLGEGPYAAALMVGLGDPSATARIANTRIHDNGRPALASGGGDSVLVSRLSVSNSPWRQTAVPWTVAIEGQRRVAIEYSTFTDNNGAHVGFEHHSGLMSASVDSSTFQGTALRGQHLLMMDVRRSRFRNTPESAVQADGVGTVSLVQSDVGNVNVPADYYHPHGGPFAIEVLGADSLWFDGLSVHDNPFGGLVCQTCRAVASASGDFANNNMVQAFPDPLTVLIDAVAGGVAALKDVAIQATHPGGGLRVNGGQRLTVRGGRIAIPDTTVLQVNSTAVVVLNGLEVTGASGVFSAGTPPAASGGSYSVLVQRADSVALDSLWIHDNAASAVWVDSARVIGMYGSRIEDNQLQLPATTYSYAVRFGRFRGVRVAQTVVDLGAAASAVSSYLQAIHAEFGTQGGARVQVDTSTILGGRALYVTGVSRTLHDTLGMVGLRAAPTMTSRTRGVYASSVGFVEAQGIEVDSTFWGGTGLYADYVGGFDIQDSRFTHVGGAVGIYADSAPLANPGPGVFSGNTITCDSAVSAVQYVVTLNYVAPATVTNNSLQGNCVLGIVASNSGIGAPQGSAVMTGNVVGSVSSAVEGVGGTMLSLQGAYKHARVAHNTTTPGVILIGSGASTIGVDSLRVDSNAVRGNFRGGIFLTGSLRATTLRGNVVDSVSSVSFSNVGISLSNVTAIGTTTRLVGNRVSRALKDGISLPLTDTTLLDSNVVVDSRTGVVVGSAKVVGRWNYIARDSTGMTGAVNSLVQMDSSVIQQNATGIGARNYGISTWNLADNYWGDSRGPRCAGFCDSASVGDSLIGPASPASYTQFLTAAPANVPTGAPPAFRMPILSAGRVGASPGTVGATRAVTPAARAGRSRPRPVRRASPAPLAPDALMLPRLPEVIW